jgi:hypothetical protein
VNLKEILASQTSQAMAVEIAPGKFIEVDPMMMKSREGELRSYCLSLPVAGGASWRQLKPWAQNNGDLAKLLIAIGELVGAWKMHPPVTSPELWGKSDLYPMISVEVKEAPSRVPKPSRGDFDVGTSLCTCCGRMMGPTESTTHDLVESMPGLGLCAECDQADCSPPGACRLDGGVQPVKKAELRVAEDEEDAPPEDLDRYLASLNEPGRRGG